MHVPLRVQSVPVAGRAIAHVRTSIHANAHKYVLAASISANIVEVFAKRGSRNEASIGLSRRYPGQAPLSNRPRHAPSAMHCSCLYNAWLGLADSYSILAMAIETPSVHQDVDFPCTIRLIYYLKVPEHLTSSSTSKTSPWAVVHTRCCDRICKDSQRNFRGLLFKIAACETC